MRNNVSRNEGRASAQAWATNRSIAVELDPPHGMPHGQGLEDAFPTADLFVDLDDQASAELLIRRFLDAFFGSNAISPTHDEYGMYLARTCPDLSRAFHVLRTSSS